MLSGNPQLKGILPSIRTPEVQFEGKMPSPQQYALAPKDPAAKRLLGQPFPQRFKLLRRTDVRPEALPKLAGDSARGDRLEVETAE